MIARLIFICIFLLAILMLQAGCSYKSPAPVDIPSSEMDDYARGITDGAKDAYGSPSWLLSGCVFGIYGGAGIVAPWLIEPKPPTQALLGKSQDYINGYIEAYQKRARVKNK